MALSAQCDLQLDQTREAFDYAGRSESHALPSRRTFLALIGLALGALFGSRAITAAEQSAPPAAPKVFPPADPAQQTRSRRCFAP